MVRSVTMATAHKWSGTLCNSFINWITKYPPVLYRCVTNVSIVCGCYKKLQSFIINLRRYLCGRCWLCVAVTTTPDVNNPVRPPCSQRLSSFVETRRDAMYDTVTITCTFRRRTTTWAFTLLSRGGNYEKEKGKEQTISWVKKIWLQNRKLMNIYDQSDIQNKHFT